VAARTACVRPGDLTALTEGLRAANLPEAAIQLVPTRDRAAVGIMLSGLDGNIDVIVPRGGKSLVARVQAEARVPVFAHLEGVCHVYVDKAASLDMAKKIVLNAKMRRTGVCGAAETLLVDRTGAGSQLKPLIEMLIAAGCEIRGDKSTLAVDKRVKPAIEEDWSTEYLDAIIAVKVVDNVEAAIDHIERYGSHHTDAIITEDQATAEKFLREVDSAIVLHNASTQFADGANLAWAPIGIATGRSMRAALSAQISSRRSNIVSTETVRLADGEESRHVRSALPPHAPGMRIGLFGGTSTAAPGISGLPPCPWRPAGPRLVARRARKSTQNTRGLAPLPARSPRRPHASSHRRYGPGCHLHEIPIRYLGW
jgi:acyl-CoA reductase-like NAD-dependent aldehyde dehydrogenase